MARITIEDCMEKVPNRFHLVRMASIRAKQLKKGARPLLTSDDNKDIVMSLREIAAGLVKPGTAELPPVRTAPVVAVSPRPAPRPAAPAAPPAPSHAVKASSSIDWDDDVEEESDD